MPQKNLPSLLKAGFFVIIPFLINLGVYFMIYYKIGSIFTPKQKAER